MLASLKNWNNAERACILSVKLVVEFLAKSYKLGIPMEDVDVDRTVIGCRQNQLDQMADFPPLLTFLIARLA